MIIRNLSVVVIGIWKKEMFIPEWFKTSLLNLKDDEKLEISVDFQEYSFAYNYENLMFVAKENSFEIFPKENTEETINKAAFYVNKFLKLITNYPVKAFGFNIKFELEKTHKNKFVDEIKKFFTASKRINLIQFIFAEKKDDCILNYIIDRQNNKLNITCNYHFDTLTEIKENDFYTKYQETIKKLS